MSPQKKIRLDISLVERGLAKSRQRAQALIMAGKVLVNRIPMDKPGSLIPGDAPITLKGEDIPYVSRGGLKLAAAFSKFDISARDRICMDVGASTGGFTDCLLQNGARRVYAVDVGYGQLAWQLRQDSRVVTIERTNIRHLKTDAVPDPIEMAVIDTSFISLKIVIPAVLQFLKNQATIIALIKPQFEVGKGKVGKGGVVRDPALHDQVLVDLKLFFQRTGLALRDVTPSPILGPKGNREFIVHLIFSGSPPQA
jgi:23S rRNA (cytidine1920-2'-O)/16S rRNA (cytidine1409-2'-O)-methyltransferase